MCIRSDAIKLFNLIIIVKFVRIRSNILSALKLFNLIIIVKFVRIFYVH